jgi:hypothetical protein
MRTASNDRWIWRFVFVGSVVFVILAVKLVDCIIALVPSTYFLEDSVWDKVFQSQIILASLIFALCIDILLGRIARS